MMFDNDDLPLDADLDLLQSHLDGELDPAATAALLGRLAVDAELAAALDGLRADRADRSVVWAAIEPDARAVDRLRWQVRGAVAAAMAPALAPIPTPTPASPRPQWKTFRPDPWRLAQFSSAAAACVVLGFFGGRLGRGPVAPPLAAVEHSVEHSGDHSAVATADRTPSPGFVQVARMAPPAAVADGPVVVPFTDDLGRVIATQRFQSADQARRFIDDLHQSRDPAAAPAGDGATRTVSELRY